MYYTHPGCWTESFLSISNTIQIFGRNRAYCIPDFTGPKLVTFRINR